MIEESKYADMKKPEQISSDALKALMSVYVGKCFAKMYLHSLGFENKLISFYFLSVEPAILSNLYFCDA